MNRGKAAVHDGRKKVLAGFQNQLPQVARCKTEYNVNVSVVRWKRPSALPECPENENAMDAISLAFARKFDQFKPSRQIGKCKFLCVRCLKQCRVGSNPLDRVASSRPISWCVLRLSDVGLFVG